MKRYTVNIYENDTSIQKEYEDMNDAIALAESFIGSSIIDNLTQTIYNFGQFEELKQALLMG